jgi:hypothetical protein
MNQIELTRIEQLIRSHAADEARQAPYAGAGPSASRAPFAITISREVGALGNRVATEIGRRLEWPVYDRNILDEIAERLRRPASDLRGLDEQPGTWLGECFSSLIDHDHFVGSGAYFQHLSAVIRGLGSSGRCVIVGRGANFLLPAATTLRVRIVSTAEDRTRVAGQRLGLSTQDAAAHIEDIERKRLGFIEGHFGKDPRDPRHYDVVLNTSRLSVDDAADLVLETLCRLENQAAGKDRRAGAGVGVAGAAVASGAGSASG